MSTRAATSVTAGAGRTAGEAHRHDGAATRAPGAAARAAGGEAHRHDGATASGSDRSSSRVSSGSGKRSWPISRSRS